MKKLFKQYISLVSAALMVLGPVLPTIPAYAAPGETLMTPTTPMELPVEVEIELSPAGSLKQALLWKETKQLLENPYAYSCTDPNDPTTCTASIERRPGFGVTIPPVNIWPITYNFLTGQPMRLRTNDGETSWDVPGPLFNPDEDVAIDAFNTPTELRSVIGHLVDCYAGAATPGYGLPNGQQRACAINNAPVGSLVISRRPPEGGGTIPQSGVYLPNHGTIVAVPAVLNGVLQELNGTSTTSTIDVTALEIPVNEENFFRAVGDTAGLPAELIGFPTGREAAEILGKALFWDMQVGSDGVQACGSCHFHAGVDNRTRNQLNPNVNGGDFELEVVSVAGSPTTNVEVIASDFPFHKRIDPETPGDGTDPAIVTSDANDVMSSMGVSRFTRFDDIPEIGTFIDPGNGVFVLPPDLGTPLSEISDPGGVAIMDGVRRIEPRHTPTFHGAAFNQDNFWDGRARFAFNGGSVFGAADPQYHIWVNDGSVAGAIHGLPDTEDTELPLNEWAPAPGDPAVPARIKFSSLASQSVGPPLSEFEMSFMGRNWAKIGKKLLQAGVTPLANQRVAIDDSRLGPYSNQNTTLDMAGLDITYNELIMLAFSPQLWANTSQHFDGTAGVDPFDSNFVLTLANGPADPVNTNQFTQMEANFSLFFGLAVQAYEELTIPDDTPTDRFFDNNPNAGHGVGEPGDQAVLFPTLIPDLVADGVLDGNAAYITLVDGFGPDEVFGFDLFAGANLTAALDPAQSIGASGRNRNPAYTIATTNADGTPGPEATIHVGSNPFTRSAKCMLCHLGPEQTDASINIDHGLLKNDAEFEFPTPPRVTDPNHIFADGLLPAPEPSGSSRSVTGLILAEEIEGSPQDAVEVEPRNMVVLDDPATFWDDRITSQPTTFAFGDQGIYNIGLRPVADDIGRGGDDPFGWPLSNAALTLKNIGGPDFEPNDNPSENNVMTNFDPFDLGATFEESGDGLLFPGAGPNRELSSLNPGFEKDPMIPLLPPYLAPWVSGLSAGELHPQIDEIGGMVPNTVTPPNGGPGIEFPEVLYGADLHCGRYAPELFGAGPPNFGWGPFLSDEPGFCPNNQSGVAGNFDFPIQGTWPVPNRVMREGAFKAPPLRNVELTGPYFHTGSFLTLRQVVDFYFRGGDFPVTNQENRDPHVVDLDEHAFSFGRTSYGADLAVPINFPIGVINAPTYPWLVSEVGFADALPDTVFLYDEYPDTNHPVTPEPDFGSRAAAIEDAKNSIVKFLLALTDPRVKYERAPFDHPELFIPIDGAAPQNDGGPAQLVSLSGVPCPVPGPGSDPAGVCFRQIPAVGFDGSVAALSAFLEVTSIPPGGVGFNCDVNAGPISHFCP